MGENATPVGALRLTAPTAFRGNVSIGMIMAIVWGGSALLFAVISSWKLPPAVNPGSIVLYLAYTLVGFAFYVSMFASILATIKDLQSSSRIQAYFYFIPIIPLMFLETIIDRPESTWAAVLSWIPFFSPMLMPARIALKAAAPWEWIGALLVLIAWGYQQYLWRVALPIPDDAIGIALTRETSAS